MFEKYLDRIVNLPVKESYSVDEILIPDFMIAKEGNMEVYYCPHNEYVNSHAKIFIVGITPGFQQMSQSIASARRCLDEKCPLFEIPYICKREARFFGQMRNNIIRMLDDLDIHKQLELASCSELFYEKDDMLHTTSLIPFAVFINGKNYTGHNPKIQKNLLLKNFLKEYFEPQASNLQNALFIPLGRSVEEILQGYINENLILKENILFGFPHPSGANGHRIRQFEENKQRMKNIIVHFFDRS